MLFKTVSFVIFANFNKLINLKDITMIIALIGYANLEQSHNKDKIHLLAYKMGQILVDNGYTVATGGFGGVMRSASMGAKSSHRYTPRSILGILPSYDKDVANEYVDLALPVGFDIARNISLISLADAVIIIGGNAGTLNEISLAWQLNKLIIALGDFGWGGKLANTALDTRRKDKIFKAKTPRQVLLILEKNLPYTLPTPQSLVNAILSQDEAKEKIAKICKISQKSLNFLGMGSEGFVFNNKNYVYKIFKPHPRLDKLYFQLSAISHSLQYSNFKPNFKLSYKQDLIIFYKYEKSKAFKSATLTQFQAFLNMHYFAKIVHLDLSVKNLCMNESGELFICDIGYDLIHFTPEFFESMCRKAFAIYKLQNYMAKIKNIKEFLSPLNCEQNFTKIEKFLACKDLNDEFNSFRKGIGEVVRYKELIYDFYARHKEYKSIFDYGSGKGDIAITLAKKFKVFAYEPNEKEIKENSKNYEGIKLCTQKDLKDLILNKKAFDSVLCSLVLCHKLAKSETQRQKIITQIMQDLCALSKKHILILICNPLFTSSNSSIQKRKIKNLSYESPTAYTKYIFSSKKDRVDIHRSLSFYESLFKKFNLKIQSITQSASALSNDLHISNSDFIMFDLIKEGL
ncbi:hypothetical protein DMC01_04325 [Campylobacter troglodytis]|nr:hypothetical protein DMC01_04325 [Campylobacter troglodytis]